MQRNIFINDFDIQEGDYVGELAQRSIGKIDKNSLTTDNYKSYHSYK